MRQAIFAALASVVVLAISGRSSAQVPALDEFNSDAQAVIKKVLSENNIDKHCAKPRPRRIKVVVTATRELKDEGVISGGIREVARSTGKYWIAACS